MTEALSTEPEYSDDQLLAALRGVLRKGSAQIEKPIPTTQKINAQIPPASGEYWTIVFDHTRARGQSCLLMGNVLPCVDGSGAQPIEYDLFPGLNYLPVSHFEGAWNERSIPGRALEKGAITPVPPGKKAPKLARDLLIKHAHYSSNPVTLRRIADQLPKDSEDRKRIASKADAFAKKEAQLGELTGDTEAPAPMSVDPDWNQ